MRKLTISLVLCVLLALPLSASAASIETKDGLEVSIITDKEDYAADEDITISVQIKNNNANSVENVSLETLLPDRLTLKTGELTISSINIGAGETYSANVVARLSDKANDNGETKPDDSTKPDDTTKPVDNQNTTNPEDTAKPGNNQDTSNPQTGDTSQIVSWIILFVVSAITVALLVVFRCKNKKSIKMLSLFLCLVMVTAVYTTTGVYATEQDNSIISVEKTIKVNKINTVIKAVVKYNMDTNKPLTEAEEYYRDNSEKVISIAAAGEDNVLSEKEAYLLMEERGFNQYPVKYEYNLDGIYVGEKSISKDSNAKHPMYQTLYITDDGKLWSIFVIGKSIVANPAFYNAGSDEESQLLIAETDTLTSYDDESNQFYATIPKSSVVELLKVAKINSETIEKMTLKEAE